MHPINYFLHCPKCAQPLPEAGRAVHVTCRACGFVYYFNPSVSVAAFVSDSEGRVLLIKRANDPGKGKLAPPGGFVDFGETAETAVRREIIEEVGLELSSLHYLCSNVNDYDYKGVTYSVLDLVFVAKAVNAHQAAALDDVESCVWLKPGEIRPEDLAFDSMRATFRCLLERNLA